MIQGKQKILCFVTNDLNQDQRMHRICKTMAALNFEVTLSGRKEKNSLPLLDMPFKQQRISCIFSKGMLFYIEYNIRIWWLILWSSVDIIYSVDTDTLLGCTLGKWTKRKKLIFDSHEYYTEAPELADRKFKKAIWKLVENGCVPFADRCLTVNQSLSDLFSKRFNKAFIPIYNVPDDDIAANNRHLNYEISKESYILYQGMLNCGRGLEEMITAMQWIPDIRLVIAGEGDLSDELRKLASTSPANDRIIFQGWLSPEDLKSLTIKAKIGLNLLQGNSLNYYYSLANKFFDYMQAGVPSINMDFPEYRTIIDQYDNGYIINTLEPEALATEINAILQDSNTYHKKQMNSLKAAKVFNWKKESEKIKNVVLALSGD